MPSLFLLTIDVGRQVFTICLPVPPPSSTRGKARASGQHAQGLSTTDRHYQHQGPQEAMTLSAWHNKMWSQEPMRT
jgi:hypothetical protein